MGSDTVPRSVIYCCHIKFLSLSDEEYWDKVFHGDRPEEDEPEEEGPEVLVCWRCQAFSEDVLCESCLDDLSDERENPFPDVVDEAVDLIYVP